jgi:hypothetical protein
MPNNSRPKSLKDLRKAQVSPEVFALLGDWKKTMTAPIFDFSIAARPLIRLQLSEAPR